MADNFTFLDASSVVRTARAKDNGGVHLSGVVLADSSGNLIAADDGAASGPIFPAAGHYQATVDEVDDGDIGRVRMTIRRGLITVPDYGMVTAFNSGGTGGATNGDIRNTTTYSFTLTAPASYARDKVIMFNNGLNQTVTVSVTVAGAGGEWGTIYSASHVAGSIIVLAPLATGTGGNSVTVAAMASAFPTFAINVTAGSSPTTGTFTAGIVWRA
jgi:hypothetical protein